MSKHEKTSKQFIGVDDGHYGIKICYGQDKYLHLKSRAAYGSIQTVSLGGEESKENNVYKVDGIKFTVADDMVIMDDKIIDPRDVLPSYPESDLNCALIYHALIKCGFTGANDLSIVTGLPFMEYFKNNQRNNKLIESKQKNLNRDVMNLDSTVVLPKISKHNVLAEGTGAFLDLLYNFDGTINKEINAAVSRAPLAIVDIGGKTTDIVTIANGRLVLEYSNTVNIGALDFNKDLSNAIISKLGLSNTLPNKVEESIKTKTYMAYNKLHDISEIVEDTIVMFSRKIQDQVVKTLKNAQDIGMVAFVGGGTNHLKPALQKIYGDQSYFVEDPEFSNARGFFKSQFVFKDWK